MAAASGENDHAAGSVVSKTRIDYEIKKSHIAMITCVILRPSKIAYIVFN
jgi:hypothetical protein